MHALLFGEVLGVSRNDIISVTAISALSIGAVCLLFLGIVVLATATALPVVGALLVFSLMTGPASAARMLTDRPVRAMMLSVGIAVVTVWVTIALSFLTDWPVGFFVGASGALAYAGRTAGGMTFAGWRQLRGLCWPVKGQPGARHVQIGPATDLVFLRAGRQHG